MPDLREQQPQQLRVVNHLGMGRGGEKGAQRLEPGRRSRRARPPAAIGKPQPFEAPRKTLFSLDRHPQGHRSVRSRPSSHSLTGFRRGQFFALRRRLHRRRRFFQKLPQQRREAQFLAERAQFGESLHRPA